MVKQQALLQKLRTWWHDLPHKRFFVWQAILFACMLWLLYFCWQYQGHDDGAAYALILLGCPLLIIQLISVTIHCGIKALIHHFTLLLILFYTLYFIFLLPEIWHIIAIVIPILYITFSLKIQIDTTEKSLNYKIILLLLAPIILYNSFFVSNICICRFDPLCQTDTSKDSCVYDVVWQLGKIRIPLFQISEKNFLHKFMRTETW